MNDIRPFFTIICLSLFISVGISCKDSSPAKEKETVEEAEPEVIVENEAPWLEPAEFESEMKKSGAVIIDIGFPADFEKGHIEGAINISFFEPGFQTKIMELDKSKKYFIYSNNKIRTQRTGIFMKESGFEDVYTLKGGIEAWKEYEQK